MCEIFPILRILVLHSLHCCLVCGSIVNSRTWDFSHQIDLKDLHGIHIQWRHFQARSNATGYKHVEQWIEIKVTGRTTGYVGVGFSPNGGMSGADMAIGWIDQNGHSHLRDFYGEWNGMPIEDESQDYVFLNASEHGEWTMIHFRRKWNTCDRFHDVAIKNDKMSIIWALGDEDPIKDRKGRLQMSWHGAINRGTESVFIAKNSALPITHGKSDATLHFYSNLNNILPQFKKPPSNSCQRIHQISSTVKAAPSSQGWLISPNYLVILCSILQQTLHTS